MNELKDNLRSRQYAKIVDLISDGPIRGVVNGFQGVYLDGTQFQSPSTGALAFSNTSFQFVNGYPFQPIMTGFGSQEAEESVSLQMQPGIPLVRSVVSPDADRCRVTVSVPQLSNTNTKTGDIDGSSVNYSIECAPDAKPFQLIGNFAISGKTMSRYQRAHIFNLPGIGPWQIRVTRTSPKHPTVDVQNDIFWDSFTTIIDDRVNYSRSACVGVQIDAEQFTTLPKRTYLVDGLLVLIPKNYDPYGASYAGVWDGTFKTDWTNNPAWVFYDLIVNNRYGLGSFITPDLVDKWALYKVATFCDQRVPNGKGGTERRFTCNVQITTQQEAFDLLSQVASIFRGFAYWAGGQLVAVADEPRDPVAQYTNANVIDGSFTYSGADIRARHTQASTAFGDSQVLGETRLAVVENRNQISRWGIQTLDDPGFGSTSESQSLRAGKWALYTEEFESEVNAFKTGLESAWVRPGDIVRVSDANIAGSRMGGRVVRQSPTDATIIIVDQRPPMVDGKHYYLSCIIPSGQTTTVVTRDAYLSATANGIRVTTAFAAPPLPDSVFVVNDPVDLVPTLWRVITNKQIDYDQYEVSGVRHFPQKWDYIEKEIAFALPDITNISKKPPPPTGLAISEYLIQTSPISVGVRCVFSWISTAPQFDVYWRKSPSGNWSWQRTDAQSIDLPITEGTFDFRVLAVSRIGIKSDPSTITKEIVGRSAPPPAPEQFRIHVIEGVAMLDWLPVTVLDVVIGGYFQLRHTATLSGATWTSAQIVIPRIPGTATSAEATYQPGTWMLRTFDITDKASETWAIIIGVSDDSNYVQWTRMCDNPVYLGNHNNTEVRMPQEWLVIKGINSGYVDDQGPVDGWTEIDHLPIPAGTDPGPNAGVYTLAEKFDAGAPFNIRLSADMLTFPFADPGDWLDDRMTYTDTWSNWDDLTGDYSGQASLQLRATLDDPNNPNAIWSDWETFTAGEHHGRGFQFRALLTAPPGQNVGVETLCIIGDFKNKYDEGNDVVYAAADVVVNYRVKFYNLPAVVLTVQNAMETDRIQIIDKERDYFIVRITNAAGVQQNRTFDWHAQGY